MKKIKLFLFSLLIAGFVATQVSGMGRISNGGFVALLSEHSEVGSVRNSVETMRKEERRKQCYLEDLSILLSSEEQEHGLLEGREDLLKPFLLFKYIKILKIDHIKISRSLLRTILENYKELRYLCFNSVGLTIDDLWDVRESFLELQHLESFKIYDFTKKVEDSNEKKIFVARLTMYLIENCKNLTELIFFDERSRKVSIDSREVELGDTFFKGVGEIGKECVRRSSILSEYGNLSKIAIFGF